MLNNENYNLSMKFSMKDRLLPYLLSAFILPLNAQTFPQPEL